jgi:GMP synthase-like glutamine amidotransferase
MKTLVILDLNGFPSKGVPRLVALSQARGWRPVVVDLRAGEPIPRADALVVSGGPGSPHAPGDWQLPLRRALRRAVLEGAPLLAICLGFQILSAEWGARVGLLEQARDGVSPAGFGADPWLPHEGEVYEHRSFGIWGLHGAPVLARGPEGDVLAARLGPAALGCAFHPEAPTTGGAVARAVFDGLLSCAA